MILSREEIERRLGLLAKIIPKTDGGNVHLEEEREALETALALYDMHLEVREVWPREAAERLRKLEQDNVALRALVEEHEELKSKLQVRVAELEGKR